MGWLIWFGMFGTPDRTDNQYIRVQRPVVVSGTDEAVQAWTYVCQMDPLTGTRVPETSWAAYLTRTRQMDAGHDWRTLHSHAVAGGAEGCGSTGSGSV